MKGRDPILLEDVDITEWISKTDDNFVLVLPNKKRLCLKKSYFLNPQINDLYLNCSLKKGNLMVQETNKSKLYRNIGYYFDKYTMIDDKELIKYLKQKKNMYELKTIDTQALAQATEINIGKADVHTLTSVFMAADFSTAATTADVDVTTLKFSIVKLF